MNTVKQTGRMFRLFFDTVSIGQNDEYLIVSSFELAYICKNG